MIITRVLLAFFVFLPAVSLATAGKGPQLGGNGPEPWMMGAGASWFDCDNDGDLDLLYLKGQGNVFLAVNKNGHFKDASEAIPYNVREAFKNKPSIATACADFNNDGWQDIVIGKAGINVLLLNNGDGTFWDASAASDMDRFEHFTSAVAPIDYNNDGLLDIFFANYTNMPNYLYRNDGVDEEGVAHFTNVADIAGVDWPNEGGGSATLGVAVGDYDNDGDPDIYLGNDFEGADPVNKILNPGPNVLFRNNGDGTFTDVSVTTGAAEPGHAMGVSFGDYNNDGWLDIFVANFWEDALLENNGDGTFTEVTEDQDIILGTPEEWHFNGWGTGFIDYDNDGDLDIHIANGYIVNSVGQITHEADQLWENMGEGKGYRFEDISANAGINQTGDARGAAYGDYNQDGLLDIFVINTHFLLEPGQDPGPARLLFKNLGNGAFQDIAFAEGLRDDNRDASAPNSWKDFKVRSWIQIQAMGAFDADSYPEGAPRTPIGSRITVRADGNTWIQDMGASSYGSQNSPYLHFGLNRAQMIDEIRVRFPNGAEQVLTNVEPNQILTIHETQGVPVRLLEFQIQSRGSGVELSWSFNHDNDLASFYVEREAHGNRELLETGILGSRGEASFVDMHPLTQQNVTYYLGAVMRNGDRLNLATQDYRYDLFTKISLLSPRPNPFTGGTGIPVRAPQAGALEIEILDVAGRLVQRLNQTVAAGETILDWNGLDHRGVQVPAGVYYARIKGGETSSVKLIKMP